MSTQLRYQIGNDPFFGRPIVDVDEWREGPRRHRYVHGAFEGTETKFSFYFPPKEEYDGRFIHMLQGGTGGTETTIVSENTLMQRLAGGLDMYFEFGAYAVESNQGHETPNAIVSRSMPGLKGQGSILTYRANAEVARFAATVAAEMYGVEPHHGYVFGGSGGGHRSVRAMENAPDVYDGAVPFMIPPPNYPVMSSLMAFGAWALRHKLGDIVDATAPGSNADPFATLNSDQREALALLYRAGFPPGAEWLLGGLAAGGPPTWSPYAEAFWTESGYEGADGALHRFLVDNTVKVRQVLTMEEVVDRAGANRADVASLLSARSVDPTSPAAAGTPSDALVGIVVDELDLDRMSSGVAVRISSGAARGRELTSSGVVDDIILCLAGKSPFDGVEPGDEIALDNKAHLAQLHFHRHHVDPRIDFGQALLNGKPIHVQRPWSDRASDPSYMELPPHRARIAGKMLLNQHLLDGTICWPAGAVYYESLVRGNMGDEADAHFRLYFTEHAHHIPARMIQRTQHAVPATRVIDYMGCIEQSIAHVIDWVEDRVEPPTGTNYRLEGSYPLLPSSATQRGGLQPVVRVRADGRARATTRQSEEVTFVIEAEMPPGAGAIVGALFDVDGSGTYPVAADGIDGTGKSLRWTVKHRFDTPGTHLVAAKVRSRLDGRTDVPNRSVENLGHARVVVE
jgi:Tannase and feruloyl esterase